MPNKISLPALQARLTGLAGWRRSGTLFLLGVCATLALPPFFLFPLLIPAFTGLLWMLAAVPTKKRAFFDGWWWGFGFFTTGLYWICISLLVDPWRFGWLIPFTLIGLNGVIALYTAAAGWLFHAARFRHPGQRVLGFALIWTLVEYARGHWFTGFPWNLVGYAWGYYDSVAQAASVVGVYGLGFITVLVACAPALSSRRTAAGLVAAFIFMAVAGAYRLHLADQLPYNERFVENVRIRVVQPNISQHHKWNEMLKMQGLRTLMGLSQSPGFDKVTHVVWPETAIPYALNLSSSLLSIIYGSVPEGGALLTGSLRAVDERPESEIWNSLAVVPHEGGGVVYYDKHHLVPFGEYIPFRAFLPAALEKITPGAIDFSRGPGPSNMSVLGAPPVSPLICYEVIFPGRVVNQEQRPDWLLNVTNDAWFGTSTGPYQHFYMAKMRSIEEGLPLVRAANTGISAVVDAYGRTLASLPLNKMGVVDERLPGKVPGCTPYGCGLGKYFLFLIAFLTALTLIYDNKRFFNN